MSADPQPPWSRDRFGAEPRCRRAGGHDNTCSIKMNAGRLPSRRSGPGSPTCSTTWKADIPAKDAAILANCPLPEVRRSWVRRLADHDGRAAGEGGIEAWLRLGEAVGLPRAELLDERHVRPGVRFAVEAYLHLARTASWPVAVAASLTELFAPDLMADRLLAFMALPVGAGLGPGLLPRPGHPGPGRRRRGLGADARPLHHRRPPAAGSRTRLRKCDIPEGDASTASSAAADTDRRREDRMDADCRPRLSSMVRLYQTG